MSVLNDMLRNLESRGAAGDVPRLAVAATRPPGAFAAHAGGGALRSPRVWVWSLTAFVVAGVTAGLAWQERHARAAHARAKPLGWSTYGAAVAQSMPATMAATATGNEPAAANASGDGRHGVPAAPAAEPIVVAAAGSTNVAATGVAATNVAATNVAATNVAATNAAAKSAAATNAAATGQAATTAPRAPAQQRADTAPHGVGAKHPSAARARTADRVAARGAEGAAAAAPPAADAARGSAEDAQASSIALSASASRDRSIASDVARAGELISRGRNSEAIPLLAQVLAREPSHAPARAALVALLAESGQRERALALLLDGAAVDVARFAAPAAQLQAELGDVAGAMATLDRVPAARRTAAHYALLGGLAQRAGRPQVAVDSYTRAVSGADVQPVWWVGLGLAHEALNQGAQARAAFVRANGYATLPSDVRTFVVARLQAVASDTRKETSATVATTAP